MTRASRPTPSRPPVGKKPPARSPLRQTTAVALSEPVRPVRSGDVEVQAGQVISRAVSQAATRAAQGRQLAQVQGLLADAALAGSAREQALRDVLEGASQDDLRVLQEVLGQQGQNGQHANPDEELSRHWRDGGYPYRNLLRRSSYELQKYQLQVELLKLQAWSRRPGSAW